MGFEDNKRGAGIDIRKLRERLRSGLSNKDEGTQCENRIDVPRFERHERILYLFKDKLGVPRKVYYPCCGLDTSPSKVFPNSEVIYVDNDEESIELLRDQGFNAHAESALNYDPGNVNLLILFNPQIDPEVPATFVMRHGFVVCNDYHNTASILSKNKDFKLIAVIDEVEGGNLQFVQDQLSDYLSEVETDEQFAKAKPGFGFISYKHAISLIKKYEDIIKDGQSEISILAAYRKLSSLAKTGKLSGVASSEDLAILSYSKLPRKKGNADSAFIYKRV